MEQLIKQACDLYDWVALLWAAFGEFPARNGSPTSIIGGHSSYFRLQEPVLDKSDLAYQFVYNERRHSGGLADALFASPLGSSQSSSVPAGQRTNHSSSPPTRRLFFLYRRLDRAGPTNRESVDYRSPTPRLYAKALRDRFD